MKTNNPFFSFLLRQTVFVNLLFMLGIAVGLFSFFDLPVERYPNVHMGKVQIVTIFPGASPEEVETLVTQKIEDALEDLPSVEFIQSTSYRGRSIVVVKFIDDSDYASLYKELRLRVLNIINELPEGIDPPEFSEIDVSKWLPAVTVNLVGDRSNRGLTLMAEEMKIYLRRIPGVKEVELSGEYEREFHLIIDPAKLAQLGLTFEDVARALQSHNFSLPAGVYTNKSGEFVVVADHKYRDRQQIEHTIIRKDLDGSLVRAGDILARAEISYRRPFVITSVNGHDCVRLMVRKDDGGNVLKIMPEVEKVVQNFAPALAKEKVHVVLTQDQRIQVDDAMTTLGNNLLVGIILVFIVVYMFMGGRNALLIVLGIPFSFLLTMIFMWLTDHSLNEITLFSFVLVSGIIVDDAIVLIENIYRNLQEGKGLRDAVVFGAGEVAWPIISATSTTIAAFLPMLIMTGSTGEFFAQVPIAITAALCASLFECLVLLPPHFLDWPGAKKAEEQAHTRYAAENDRFIMRWLQKWALKLVTFTLRHRLKTILLVVLVFAGAVFMLVMSVTGKMQFIHIKFFPSDYNIYYVDLIGPPEAAIEVTSQKLKEISCFVVGLGSKVTRSATAQAGMYVNEDYEAVFGSNLGHIMVELPNKEDRDFPRNPDNDPEKFLLHMRKILSRFNVDGWKVRVREEPGGPPAGKSVNIRVVGPNPGNVTLLARKIKEFLISDKRIAPYLVNFEDNQGQKSRMLRFEVKDEQAAQYNLTPREVTMLAASVLDGRYVGKFRTRDEDIDLKLKIDPAFLRLPENALSLSLISHPAGPIRLGDVCTLKEEIELDRLNRYQNNRAITLSSNLVPGAPVSPSLIVSAVREFYQKIKNNYPGAEINFAGEFESTRKSYISLSYAFIVAVLIIYLILSVQFQSYTQPFIILSTIIFSLTGVILGKFISQGLFTVNSFIATVGISGVVVNDALVLIDFINKRYHLGLSRKEAILEGVRIRLRPILLTTLTTTLGLLPMAIGFPFYSLTWGSMASTFVTGLCTATFLTLFIVPILWDLLMACKEKWSNMPV